MEMIEYGEGGDLWPNERGSSFPVSLRALSRTFRSSIWFGTVATSTSIRCEMDKTAWEGNAKQASYIEWISSTIDEL